MGLSERAGSLNRFVDKPKRVIDRHWKIAATAVLVTSLVPTAYASHLLDKSNGSKENTSEVSAADIAKASGSITLAVAEYGLGAAIILNKKMGKE